MADHGNATVYISGLTASAATIIAMGAKRIVMSGGAAMLVHNASLWVATWGSYNKEQLQPEIEQLQRVFGDLATLDNIIAQVYAARSGKPIEEMAALMAENKWIGPKEALDIGLIDAIDNDLQQGQTKDAKAGAHAMQRIVAIGLPTPTAALPAPTEQPPANENLLAAFVDKIERGFERIVNALSPKPETPKPNNHMHTNILQTLNLQTLDCNEQGGATLTAEQLTQLNNALQAPAPKQQAPEPDKTTELNNKIAELEKQITALQQDNEALQHADGDQTQPVEVTDTPENAFVSDINNARAAYETFKNLL